MKHITLTNGDRMPMLGLGTWKADEDTVYRAVTEAVRAGYRHIDCAAIYGNEKAIGRALADLFREGVVSREDLWITSKLWNNAHKERDVRPALKRTLSDLGLDSLDLYLIHWPVVFRPDVTFPESDDDYLSLDEVPIMETWRALEACVDEGLTRNIGVSNFSVRKLDNLLGQCRICPAVNQVEGHPVLQQPALKAFCDEHGVVVTAYSPLGSTDRPAAMRADDEPDLMALEPIREIASAHDATPAQILLAWAVNRGTVTIPKSANPGRLRENLAAADIELTDDEMARIGALDEHRRLLTGEIWKGPYNLRNLWDE
ncbi:MAG: aldo/keto reductase [Pseudomonadota bacterium]